MASLAQWLKKPEYIYRPTQIARRLRNALQGKPNGSARVTLPWGLPIEVRPGELIGASIWRMGVYDLAVTEAIWRLLDKGEHAVDAGTNIGHMSSVMAVRVGPNGRVDSFEPHPTILKSLRQNVGLWSAFPFAANVIVHPNALSQDAGRVTLNISDDFETNQGGSFLVDSTRPPVSQNVKHRTVEVEAVRLDDMLGSAAEIALMKIDVEGHEMSVLRGGASLFDRKIVRDVIFEEYEPYPTDVTAFFEDRGYTVFRIEKRFCGLGVDVPAHRSVSLSPYDTPNYLATRDPARAKQRFSRGGWQSLRGRAVA